MLLKLRNQRLLIGAPKTFLQVSASVGETATTVLDTAGFTGTNKYVQFGDFGDEQTEIVVFTSITGTTTLTVAALTKDHPKGTPVYLIQANQIDFYYSADGITYSSAAKKDIEVGSLFTFYEDNAHTSGYGKSVFYNSAATANYRTFYEIIQYNKSNRKTRGFVKDLALDEMGAVVDGDFISEEGLDFQVELCDERIREEKLNWKEETYTLQLQSENGITKYDLSSYLKDSDTDKSILYAGFSGHNVIPMTRDDFRALIRDVATTTLAVAIAAITEVTITLTDSSEFADEGTILIEGDEISYTANNRTTNVLSGVTGITAVHATTSTAGRDMEVWQGADTGIPKYLTIIDGVMHTYPVISDDGDAEDLSLFTLDISKKFDDITLDSDELAFPTTLYIAWVKAYIARKRGDADVEALRREFEALLDRRKSRDISAVNKNFTPSGIIYSASRRRPLI
jgi:hypothetical protein